MSENDYLKQLEVEEKNAGIKYFTYKNGKDIVNALINIGFSVRELPNFGSFIFDPILFRLEEKRGIRTKICLSELENGFKFYIDQCYPEHPYTDEIEFSDVSDIINYYADFCSNSHDKEQVIQIFNDILNIKTRCR